MRELERGTDPNGRDTPALAIIGAGRVGGALRRAALANGVEAHLAGREDAADAAARAEVVLLCVPDSEIEEACASIEAAGAGYVGHTSGARGVDALASAADGGSETFCLHPLQTVPDGETELAACPCAISGSSAEALRLATELALWLGMRPFEIDDSQRAAYHAAASIASNFLVALEESAAGLLDRAGIADARELLAPLVLRTAENWAERGAGALTGPIVRGDEQTVERHVEAIRELDPDLLELYEALATRTRAAARQEATA